MQDMETFADNFVKERAINRNVLVHPAINAELQAFRGEIKSRYGFEFGH